MVFATFCFFFSFISLRIVKREQLDFNWQRDVFFFKPFVLPSVQIKAEMERTFAEKLNNRALMCNLNGEAG